MFPDIENERESERPAVAVVVLHGVGEHVPCESARAVSRLLFRFPPLTGRYAPFHEARISVERSPVLVTGAETPAAPSRLAPFEERSSSQRRSHAVKGGEGPRDVGHEFMRAQLAGYKGDGPGALYETVRLESVREPGPDGGSVDVHVFEVFWADVSRPAGGALRFFADLYQLLFHLASLGRQVIGSARAEHGNPPRWRLYWWLQAWTIRLLTLFLPALNLSLLAASGTLLLPSLSETSRLLVAVVVAALGVASVFGFLVLRRREGRPLWFWGISAALVLVAGGTIALIAATQLSAKTSEPLLDLLTAEWWVVATALLALLLSGYQRHRPGALPAGLAIQVLCLLGYAVARSGAPASERGAAWAGFQVFQGIVLALEGVWFLLLVGVLLSALAGLVVAVASTKRATRRIVWTARFSLALPTTLLMILTLTLWGLLFRVARAWIVPMNVMPWPFFRRFGVAGPLPLAAFLDELLSVSATLGFVLAPLGFALFLGAAFWAVLPSIRGEISPPPADDSRAASFEGGWVTHGIRLVGAAGDALTVVLVGALVGVLAWLSGWTLSIDARPLLSAAAFVMLLLLASRRWLKGARTALDILLDVDHYMREHPRDASPRARIAERYVSLLRYLCSWKGPRGSGYRGLVLLSHSQGAVITSDLLRFVKREKDERLERLFREVRLASVTVGSPLRQLYALCFPDHYSWLGPPPERAPSEKPDPEELGLEEWVNAYRGGDYIGRNLWFPPAWIRRAPFVTERRRELPLGAGAHTHYWDQRGEDLGAALDELIVRLARGAPRSADHARP